MSSVFSKPKVVQVQPEEVEPVVVDNSEEGGRAKARSNRRMEATLRGSHVRF